MDMQDRETFKTTEALPRVVEPGFELRLLIVKVCEPVESVVVSKVTFPVTAVPFGMPSTSRASYQTPLQTSLVGRATTPLTVELAGGLRMEIHALRFGEQEDIEFAAGRHIDLAIDDELESKTGRCESSTNRPECRRQVDW